VVIGEATQSNNKGEDNFMLRYVPNWKCDLSDSKYNLGCVFHVEVGSNDKNWHFKQ
jgi:hypothetical protein